MRLFVAVEIDARVRQAAAGVIADVARSAPDAKWVSEDKLHLTLAFLGEVSEDALEAIQAAIEAAARAHAALRLHLRGGGGFGGRRHPRVVWLGVEGDTEALSALQATLVRELVPTGFEPDERGFRAHLTIARAREQRGDVELAQVTDRLRAVDCGSFTVDRLVLLHSQPGPGGSRYSPLFYAALRPRPPPPSDG